MASGRASVVLNAMIPGVGHMVLGYTYHGIGILVAWIICWVMILIPGGVPGLLNSLGIKQSTEPFLIVTPIGLIGAVIVYMYGLLSAQGIARRMTPKKVDMPTQIDLADIPVKKNLD